jgi:hypothetical protein
MYWTGSPGNEKEAIRFRNTSAVGRNPSRVSSGLASISVRTASSEIGDPSVSAIERTVGSSDTLTR